MGFFRQRREGGGCMERSRSGPKLTECREIYKRAISQRSEPRSVHKSPRQQLWEKSAREQKSINSLKGTGRENVGGNREIKIYAGLGLIRWRGRGVYFKVNVWQFRWNHGFPFQLKMKMDRRGWKDKNGRQQGGRESCSGIFSLGTHEKTLKILTHFKKWIAAPITAVHRELKNIHDHPPDF